MPNAQIIDGYKRRTELAQRVWAKLISEEMEARHGEPLPSKSRTKAKLLAYYEAKGLVAELLDACCALAKRHSAVY